jgi:uncharacterized RDD family membrane protein YckC
MNGSDNTRANAGFLRRAAAVGYDSLLLSGVLFLATVPLLPVMPASVIEPGNIPYMIYLLAVAWLYFAWHWTHGGQTLGMKAWRLRLRSREGGDVSLAHASLRFACALLSWLPAGAGFFWAIVDPQHLALHDRLSGTMLEVTARPD